MSCHAKLCHAMLKGDKRRGEEGNGLSLSDAGKGRERNVRGEGVKERLSRSVETREEEEEEKKGS